MSTRDLEFEIAIASIYGAMETAQVRMMLSVGAQMLRDYEAWHRQLQLAMRMRREIERARART